MWIEIPTALSKIWTWFTKCISSDDNLHIEPYKTKICKEVVSGEES